MLLVVFQDVAQIVELDLRSWNFRILVLLKVLVLEVCECFVADGRLGRVDCRVVAERAEDLLLEEQGARRVTFLAWSARTVESHLLAAVREIVGHACCLSSCDVLSLEDFGLQRYTLWQQRGLLADRVFVLLLKLPWWQNDGRVVVDLHVDVFVLLGQRVLLRFRDRRAQGLLDVDLNVVGRRLQESCLDCDLIMAWVRAARIAAGRLPWLEHKHLLVLSDWRVHHHRRILAEVLAELVALLSHLHVELLLERRFEAVDDVVKLGFLVHLVPLLDPLLPLGFSNELQHLVHDHFRLWSW